LHELSSSLGTAIKSLSVGTFVLPSDFWASLDTALPAVQVLNIGGAACDAADLSSFCLSRPADRPFTLELMDCQMGDDWPQPWDEFTLREAESCKKSSQYLRLNGDQLQADLEAAGMGHVKITRDIHWNLFNDL
jgi:hypothetical protein